MSALFAIAISCLGLLGLASLAVARRTKEVGIRKVLGASSQRLFGMLAKEYLIVVGTANLIAAPLAYYLAKQWLEDFAFRIDLDPLLFVQASLLTI